MSIRKPVEPEDFGPARYGVHLFSHEEDWGWTAYGHPETRRLVAACLREARENGIIDDLRVYPYSFGDKAIERKWAVSVESPAYYDFELRWCSEGAAGAMPVTVVTP